MRAARFAIGVHDWKALEVPLNQSMLSKGVAVTFQDVLKTAVAS
jgi:hypothetical protein